MGAFDAVAARYDELWTRTPIGRLQRDAVWRRIDPLLHPGDSILDMGCGTGEDAVHFMGAGVRVRAIDASAEMVRIARGRGVDATQLTIEELDHVSGCFDAVISNFGALNCVAGLDAIRTKCSGTELTEWGGPPGPQPAPWPAWAGRGRPARTRASAPQVDVPAVTNVSTELARLVRPGGYLAICVMSRFCLWETAWYLSKGQARKAFRRFNGNDASSSLGIQVFYPSVRQIERSFHPEFRLVNWYGVGIAVPPSYVSGRSDRTLTKFAEFDRHTEGLPLIRAVSDHRLLIFERSPVGQL